MSGDSKIFLPAIVINKYGNELQKYYSNTSLSKEQLKDLMQSGSHRIILTSATPMRTSDIDVNELLSYLRPKRDS